MRFSVENMRLSNKIVRFSKLITDIHRYLYYLSVGNKVVSHS